MNKAILFAFAMGCFSYSAHAQSQVNDSVSIGAGYVNQVWYSLETGQKTSIAADEWDIAFPTNNRSVAVRINDGGGVHLWKYPDGDQTSWATLDTAGLSSWKECYNSESDWDLGAFNDHASSGQFDYGWGDYDVSDHHVRAKSVFIIQLTDGSFRKIMIEDMDAVSGTYSFKYADLDGSNEITDTLHLADFNGKNFAYYSLENNQELNPEPQKNEWDLLFTQYTSMIPAGPDTMAYVVTGVVSNVNEGVAKVEGVEVSTYEDYESHTLDSAKNVIGYDWKSYDMNGGGYQVADSTLFFILDKNENIWKVVFTGFGGSSNGNFIFSKEKLFTTGIHQGSSLTASVAVYPNPATQGYFTVAYQLNGKALPVMLQVTDLSGRVIYHQQVNAQLGMNQQKIETQNWAQGAYFLTLNVAGESTTQKVIIR